MSNVVALTDRFRPAQISLIQRMNPDANIDEFNVFMSVAADLGLDPLKKQIYCFVFNKDNPDKRRMAIVVGIDGFRAIAKRSGHYRPDTRAPRFTYDERLVDEASNPLGIESVEVSIYQHSHGDWHEITAVAYWTEFAPVIEGGEWKTNDNGKRYLEKNGKRMLDPNKENWRKMPRLMLAECAEAQAIRRAWPEDLSAIYSDDELDRAKTLDLTASEIVEKEHVQERLAKIGGAEAIMFDMGDGLERIPLDKAGDMLMERFGKMQPHEVMQWKNANRVPLQEFWARAKADALEIKKYIEAIETKVDE
jgi:phage recombination protein Bet